MSFLAKVNPPPAGSELPVSNDPWFPAIDPAQLRATCRLDGTVTPERLQHALMQALASVNAELWEFKVSNMLLGHASLADVPAGALNGESVKAHHYRRAVYACVQADLAEAYREIDTTPQSAGKVERVTDRLELKVDEHRRNQRWAISDLLGLRRTTVDLI